jgi:hypothetical protein
MSAKRGGVMRAVMLLLSVVFWAQFPAFAEPAPSARDCPAPLQSQATCYGGQDANGAYYLIAIPKAGWNKRLIVHAHGGPRMSTPKADDSDEDLARFSVMVAQGYAWIGSVYRKEGYGVRRAAADVEASRALFWRHFGRPERTILHGQSWGAQIALKVLEDDAREHPGKPRYDAALLTNGVVAGGVAAYQFRAELRAIYQFYCRNHPRPDEPQYPLWMGLPPGAKMTRDDLNARVRACSGVGAPAEERAPDQKERLADILGASGVKEEQLRTHLAWGTFTMRTLVETIGGGNPFDNRDVRYAGVRDPAALNAGIDRFAANAAARDALNRESEPTGLTHVPIMTLHGQRDPQVSIGLQKELANIYARTGRDGQLVQIALDWAEHSRLPDPVVAQALVALENWVVAGQRPTAHTLQAGCLEVAAPAACSNLIQP